MSAARSNILSLKLPLEMVTDSKKLSEVMTKGQQTTEKRLMIGISAAREAYRSFDSSRVGLVSTIHNPEDEISKVNGNGALRTLMCTGYDRCPVEQWRVFLFEKNQTQSNRKNADCETILCDSSVRAR